MKYGYLSDIHAGQAGNPELAEQTRMAVQRGVDYARRADVRIRMLLGDTVHHLDNVLAPKQLNRELALEQLAPLAALIREQRHGIAALAGNTDWGLADTENPAARRDAWIAHTGFDPDLVAYPDGGLFDDHPYDEFDSRLVITHGHAFDRLQRGDHHAPVPEDFPILLRQFDSPSAPFVQRISDPMGPHAVATTRMANIGKHVKKLPGWLRHLASDVLGWRMKTRAFEPELANLMRHSGIAEETGLRSVGVMGHSHIAGIRRYGKEIVVNTGSFGARNIPTQRVSDQTAHMAVVDDDRGTIELVRTYDPSNPRKKPDVVRTLDLRTREIL